MALTHPNWRRLVGGSPKTIIEKSEGRKASARRVIISASFNIRIDAEELRRILLQIDAHLCRNDQR